MELTGPSLAARLAWEGAWNDARLSGGSRGWGPGSNGWLGGRRSGTDLTARSGQAEGTLLGLGSEGASNEGVCQGTRKLTPLWPPKLTPWVVVITCLEEPRRQKN